MLMDPRLEDYYAALFSFYGVQVLVHGNQDYPEISARGILLAPLKEAFLQVLHHFVFVPASIQCLHTQYCLYQQVSSVSTLNIVCTSKYPVSPHSILSIPTSIQCLHTQYCLYQQVSSVSTLNIVCTSKYLLSPHSILSVSASIQCLYTQYCLYQQVFIAPVFICICISKYPHFFLYPVMYRGGGFGGSTPLPRNSEVFTKLSQIPSSVENTSVTT
jgi:hypothetical protein